MAPYDIKRPLEYWGIDYVGPLIETKSCNEYLITAINSRRPHLSLNALPARSADVAIELEELI
jgi:hypothetical protein